MTAMESAADHPTNSRGRRQGFRIAGVVLLVVFVAGLAWGTTLSDEDPPRAELPATSEAPDFDFRIFFRLNAPPQYIDAVRVDLEGEPLVSDIVFIDHEEAFAEFQEIFSDDPEALENASPAILPQSFKVSVGGGPGEVTEVASRFEDADGVREVTYPATPPFTEAAESAGNDLSGLEPDRTIIFLQPNASDTQISRIRRALEDSDLIDQIDFTDQQEALVEFRRLFSDDPALLESVTAEMLPTSFKVTLGDELDEAARFICRLAEDTAVRQVAIPPSLPDCG